MTGGRGPNRAAANLPDAPLGWTHQRKEVHMRHRMIVGLALVLVIGALLGTSRARGHVQQATPPAASGITGVKVETLGRGPSRAAPGHTLLLFRLTFAP